MITMRKAFSIVLIFSILASPMSLTSDVEVVVAEEQPWLAPTIQFPAQIYWGGYANMDQLVEEGAQWDFVKKNMDGFLFHGAYWRYGDYEQSGAEVVGPKLASLLAPYNKGLFLEVGIPHPPMPADSRMGPSTGQNDLQMLQGLRSWGLNVDMVTSNYNLYAFKMLKNYNPDYSSEDIIVEATGDRANYPNVTKPENGQWADYYSQIVKTYPNISYSHTNSPVYMSWDNYSAMGTGPLTFRDINITGNMLVESAFNAGNDVIGKRMTGFVSDSPYSYMLNTDHRNKIIAYESWLHANSYTHTFVVNADGLDALSETAADLKYHDDSMAGLQLYQSNGGRADTYLFESWYPWPYNVVPETTEGTYTNLIMDVLKYIKGIEQDLDLTIKEAGDPSYYGDDIYISEPGSQQFLTQETNSATKTFSIQVTNDGDVTCMPNIRALERGDSGWNITYTYNSTDITSDVLSNSGYTFTGKLTPGSTATVTATVTPSGASNGQERTFDIVAFWNPQDPTGIVRDVASANVTRNTSISDGQVASGTSGSVAPTVVPYTEPTPTGIYETENAVFSGGASTSSTYSGYTGTGYADFSTTQTGSSATFTIDADEAGNKKLLIRYANGDVSEKTLSLYVNGVKEKQLNFETVVNNDWTKWNILRENLILDAGDNTIKIQVDAGDSSQVNIDSVVVVDSSIYEAEDANLSGVNVAATVKGFSGNGFMSGFDSVGDFCAISVDGGIGGNQTLKITYANGSGSSKTLSLYNNNTKIKQVTFADTGSWRTWSTITETVNIASGSGNNAITFKVDNGDTGGIYLDQIDLSNVTYEAEGNSVKQTGRLVEGVSEGPAKTSGSGYTMDWGQVGDSAEFDVYSYSAGTKTLSIKYYNDSNTDQTISLFINGSKLRQITLPAYSYSWNPVAWRISNELVTLNAGSNSIKLKIKSGDSGDVLIDNIEVMDGSISMTPPNPQPDSLDTYEFESGALSGVSTVLDYDGFSGLGYVEGLNASNDSVSISIDGGTGGGKEITLFYRNQSTATTKTASLYINGNKVEQLQLTPTEVDGGGYFTPRAWGVQKLHHTLESGMNTFKIQLDSGDSGDIALDKIEVEDFGFYTEYQAEETTFTGVSIASNHLGYTGSGFLDSWDAQNDSSTLSVDAVTGGSGSLLIRYANANGNTRTLSLYVNGTKIKQISLPQVVPGDWSRWGTVEETINLNEGTNLIKLQYDSGDDGVVNVDKMIIMGIDTIKTLVPEAEIKYEAEQATLNGVNTANNHSGYTGTGFTDSWDAVNDSSTFTVDGGSGGNVKLNIRYANANGNTRSLSLYVNGSKIKQSSFPQVAPGDWSQWGTIEETISLSSGTNTIKLQYDSGDDGIINVDNIIIIKAVQHEAEDASLNGVNLASNHSGYTGTGFTDSWDTVNDACTFTVDGGSGGNVTLNIRYANANGNTRTLSLYVNGSKIKQASFPQVAPGDWSQWGTIEETINLNSGSNTVKLQYDSGDDGIINVDNIVIN